MRIPFLDRVPGNYREIPGKQLYLVSGSPPMAQSIIDGNPKAQLRIIREPLFNSNLYPAAGIGRLDFFQAPINQPTAQGLLQTVNTTNMTTANTIGEPEVFDFVGLSLVFGFGTTPEQIAQLVNDSTINFQWSSSQQVYSIPTHQIPASTGMAGVGHLGSAPVVQVGAPFQSNYYDVTVDGYPRRIWSQETFQVFLTWDNPPAFLAPIFASVLMQGVRYIR